MSDWKYDVDEVGEDADSEPDPATSDADPDPSDPGSGDPDGRNLEPLEPGSPTAENAFFVVLGVATMLFLFARVIAVAGG